MTDVAEKKRLKRDTTRLGGWARPSHARIVYAVFIARGCAHFRHITFNITERLDEPDPAGLRLPLRVEIRYGDASTVLPVFDGPSDRPSICSGHRPAVTSRCSNIPRPGPGRQTDGLNHAHRVRLAEATNRIQVDERRAAYQQRQPCLALRIGAYVKGNNGLTKDF